MAQTKSDLATIAAVAQLLAVVLTVSGLYFARDVFIPLALGVLLSFLLSPVVNRLQRRGVPNVAAVITTAALAFLLLAGGFTLLGRELSVLIADLPQHKDELVAKARSVAGLTTGVGGSLGKLADEVSEAMEGAGEDGVNADAAEIPESSLFAIFTDKVFPIPKRGEASVPHDGTSVDRPLYVQAVRNDLPLASWASSAGTVLGPLATAGLVSVIAIFMLIHREDLRDRMIAVISHDNYVTTTEALDEAAGRISRYLMAQTIVNTSYGLVLTFGLTVIGSLLTPAGFPNVILWGVLATCLRFVPYIGPIVAAIFPLAIALSVFPGYGVALAVLGLIVTMELLSNNILEPWLYGASTGISAVAVIVAAVFWSWLWGPVGLLLSTPLTVCLVVLGRYVPRFRMLATLLGEEVEIKVAMRFYQRLLAGDEHRATEMLQQHAQQTDFDTTCDEVIIPAIKRLRLDHDAEELSDQDADRLLAITERLIGGMGEPRSPDQAAATSDKSPLVVGCSAHHHSETMILNLLQISGSERFNLLAINEETLPDEVAQQIKNRSPAVVVIAVVPQGGFAQARYLCKSIRANGYRGPIVVACFGRFKNFDKLFVKFRKSGATSMTTTFLQTRLKIDSILRRHDPVAATLRSDSRSSTKNFVNVSP
jgi:predicted PurR-regulated permease PerM